MDTATLRAAIGRQLADIAADGYRNTTGWYAIQVLEQDVERRGAADGSAQVDLSSVAPLLGGYGDTLAVAVGGDGDHPIAVAGIRRPTRPDEPLWDGSQYTPSGGWPTTIVVGRGPTHGKALDALLDQLGPELAEQALRLLHREPRVTDTAATAVSVLAAGGDLDAVRQALDATHASLLEVCDLQELWQEVDARAAAAGLPEPDRGPRTTAALADWLREQGESSLLRRANACIHVLRARGPQHMPAHITLANRWETGHGSADLLLEIRFHSLANGLGGGREIVLAGLLPLHRTGGGVIRPGWYETREQPTPLVLVTHGADGTRTVFTADRHPETLELAWRLVRDRLALRALDGQAPLDQPAAPAEVA